LAADPAGNLFISDDHGRIRRVDAATGTISTVAGNGEMNFSGGFDEINYPSGLALDGVGNLYIAASEHDRVRKVDPAGNLTVLSLPGSGYDVAGLAIDPAGNLLMSSTGLAGVFRRDPGPAHHSDRALVGMERLRPGRHRVTRRQPDAGADSRPRTREHGRRRLSPQSGREGR